MDYSKTVNLPKTDFSMKANLTTKEPEFVKRWDKIKLYNKIIEKRRNSDKKFILHDGPPYANGDIHIGTALNKILKDVINKYKFLRGYYVNYVPGWDCHGLPIELKTIEKIGSKVHQMSVLDIRKECRAYAEKYVKIQMDGFKRLGVIGDFENPYLTMSKEYETSIVMAFAELVKRGYIYRGLRPIHWCIDCNTSLAEAEIEYGDHISPSIYVKFPVIDSNINELKNNKAYVLIWTTTPWTLPANTGLSLNPEEKYSAVLVNDEYLIFADKLIESVLSLIDKKPVKTIPLTRKDLESLKVKHPWEDRESKVVFGSHVTMDTGTGVVHTAPGHGMEDYFIGLEYKLEMLSPVDDKGYFTKEAGRFAGLRVTEANSKIIEFLESNNLLFYKKEISHSYPHCWRCKKPIIFRSKPQWFFKVSNERLSKMTLDSLSNIKWFPEWGESRIRNMLTNRPDWCLSRQRHWGVPIPAFYCENCDEVHLNTEILDFVINILREEGIEAWYLKDTDKLLPENYKCKCGSKKFRKETDILDVWFDSGVSHYAVLDQRADLGSPADVYLEGNDQYRGWFQASLWPSMAIRERPPFKEVITHGWVLDEKGRQMHKSLGNAVSPSEVYNKYGADILRLWVMMEDYRADLRIGETMIQKAVDNYRKIRNTFKYLLGNLYDFEINNSLEYNQLDPIDKYALALLYNLDEKVKKYFDEYEFYRGYREIYNFCAVDLSSYYLDVLKDRLYIYPTNSKERLSAQTAMYNILKSLTIMLSPILCFTCEEVYLSYFSKNKDEDSVHLSDWFIVDNKWNNQEIINDFNQLLELREDILKSLEGLRTAGIIGNSVDSSLTIKPLNNDIKNVLNKYKENLRYYFIVSQVNITDNDIEGLKTDKAVILSEKAKGNKCARCWNYSEKVGSYSDHPELCERCYPIVKKLTN